MEDPPEHRECVNISVIVDCCLTVSVQVERIDHVEILEVCRSCLVSYVYRMLERQIPDREGLKLGVSCLTAALVFVIYLRKRCRELAGSTARTGHDYQRLRNFYVYGLAP